MTNNPETGFLKGEDIPINIPTPPEVMAGSTHLGPGIDRNPTRSCYGWIDGECNGKQHKAIYIEQRIFIMSITKCYQETAASKLQLDESRVLFTT